METKIFPGRYHADRLEMGTGNPTGNTDISTEKLQIQLIGTGIAKYTMQTGRITDGLVLLCGIVKKPTITC
jgi:hypothetical protein